MNTGRPYKWIYCLVFSALSGFAGAQENYVVERLSFSSRVFNDFTPVYYGNGIVFCSDRRTGVFQGYVANENNEAQSELFFVSRTDKLEWGKPQPFDETFSSLKFEGPATFSPDGKQIYFTRNYDAGEKKKRKKGNPNYGIFISRLENGHWTTPEPFPYNNPEHKMGHPCLSPDGTKLYFASDEAGGFGGSDIYVCYLENGQWGRPRNLGPVINGPFHEMFPYVHTSGRLYFASDRPGGAGKLDIYFTVPVKTGWLPPICLPAPFNSPDDDFSFIAREDLSSGYFTSSRFRTDNIFVFRSVLPRLDSCKEVEENRFTYEIFEPGTRDLDTLTYEYEWDLDQGVVMRGRVVEHTFTPGDYLLKLNVVDTLTGAIMANVATYPLHIEKLEQVHIAAPDTVYTGEEVLFSGEDTYLPEMIIGEYYWNFGDGTGTTGVKARHVFLVPGVYRVQLIAESRATYVENRVRVCGMKKIVVLHNSGEIFP